MGICYWCYWGWPKPIKDIYDRALAELDGWKDPLEFGPGHIVWSDENWDSADWCLEHFDEYRGDYSDEDLAIVKRSLVELLAVPEEFREPPEEYDDENPADFPPPVHWECNR